MIEFVEEKHTGDPRQPGLLVHDRDLLRQLMLPLVLVRRHQVELGHVGIHEEFVVQVSIRGQADQAGGWRERRRQPRARAGLERPTVGERRRSHLVEIGWVVERESRLRRQHFVEAQRRSILHVDVARQQQIRPAIEDDAQLAPCRGDIVAAKRMIRMFEVADVAVADATRERDRPHHPVTFERATDPRVGAKLAEVPGGKIGGRLEVVRGRLGDQVQRSTDRVASVQGALRPAKHFDAIEIEKLHELHRRSSQVDAVEVHRRTRIRPRVQHVGADPADRQLTETGILGKRDGRCERSGLTQRVSSQPAKLGIRDGTDRHGNGLNVAFAHFCSRDDRFFQDGEAQGEGHRDRFAGLHAHGTTLRLESAQLCGNFVVTLRKVWKREVAGGAGVRRADGDTPNRHVNAWQRGTCLVDDGTDHLSDGLCRRGSGHAEEHQGRSEQFHGSTQDVCIFLRREDTGGSHTALRV